MTVSRRLAEFVVGTPYSALPPGAVVTTRRALLDTLGVALAGSIEKASAIVIAQARECAAASGASGIIAGGFRAAAAEAAFANGVLAHVLDYDDVGVRAQGHPSAVLFPAALALAEQEGSSGSELVAAYVLGLEVLDRISLAMPMLHSKGWHPTSALGTFGAAAAAARLLRLDVAETTMALGIAASMTGGLTQNFGTFTKSLHAGHSARCGVHAALLARDGFTAALDVFEGEFGVARAFFAGQPVDVAAMAADLGRPFLASVAEINVKKYPCCLQMHRALDAILALAREHDLAADDVARIDCELPLLAPRVLFHHDPQSRLEAKFSIEFCMATALIERRLGLGELTDANVRRPDIRALGRRVHMHSHPGAQEGDYGEDRPDVVTITRADGRVLSKSVLRARGHAEAPLGWDELADKFRDCAGVVMPPAAVAQAIDLVGRIEMLDGVGELMRLLSTRFRPGIAAAPPTPRSAPERAT